MADTSNGRQWSPGGNYHSMEAHSDRGRRLELLSSLQSDPGAIYSVLEDWGKEGQIRATEEADEPMEEDDSSGNQFTAVTRDAGIEAVSLWALPVCHPHTSRTFVAEASTYNYSDSSRGVSSYPLNNHSASELNELLNRTELVTEQRVLTNDSASTEMVSGTLAAVDESWRWRNWQPVDDGTANAIIAGSSLPTSYLSTQRCTAILPIKQSNILLLEEDQCLHRTHMEEAAQLMREQFRCRIEVTVNISTAGYRTSEAEVVFFLAEIQENDMIGHWVCLHFNSCCQRIQIYDSCSNKSKKWKTSLLKQVTKLFGRAFSTELMSSPQQNGDTHCGLYTIANGLCICQNGHVPQSGYDQQQMLRHLKQCIRDEIFSELFPEKI